MIEAQYVNNEAMPVNVWVLAAFSISFAVTAQLLMKIGMTALRAAGRLDSLSFGTAWEIVLQPAVFFGLASYGVSAALWLLVLSRMPLSMAYPLISLGILAVVLLSVFALGENVSAGRAAGVAFIVAGVFLIGFSR
jgi:drug/metabolite transporter (DMT)-like permease